MKRTIIVFTMLGLFMAWPVHAQNLIGNGDFESLVPSFWSPLNATFGTDVFASTDTATSGFSSFKITKSAAGANEVGWESVDNANLYWNDAKAGTYALSAMVKTEGVNTSPATDADKIGVVFTFNDTLGAELSTVTLWADQTAASTPFTQLTGAAILSERPGDVFVKLIMGSGATGTVYFDEIGCGTDPWSMGIFNSGAEDVNGWMDWYSSTAGGFTRVTDTDAHSGTYAVEMFLPDTSYEKGTELVYYSIPYPVEAGEWYKISVWVKTVGVIDSSAYEPTYIMKERFDERVNLCYFFHGAADITTDWGPLPGGDKFVYVNQVDAATGWTQYMVAEQAPVGTEPATGISVRARFNPKTTGTAYFDDFSVEKMVVSTVAIDERHRAERVPTEYQLAQNFPNPFNPQTTIQFSCPKTSWMRLDIYNILGQRVATLADGVYQGGMYHVNWEGVDDRGVPVASGVYIYTLTTNDTRIARKMLLIR